MSKFTYTAVTVAIAALVTMALRFLPFLIFGGKREQGAFLSYIGKVLPYAIMAMLVVYCMKNVSFGSLEGFLPELIAGVTVAGLHIWKRNTLLSILGGTVLYMLLVQVVF